jgi:hypothetical protein
LDSIDLGGLEVTALAIGAQKALSIILGSLRMARIFDLSIFTDIC